LFGNLEIVLLPTIELALDAVPKQIDFKGKDFLLTPKGVKSIHDLHILAIRTSQFALSVQLLIPIEQI
jgi:Co/Zn/Cd efflux system component